MTDSSDRSPAGLRSVRPKQVVSLLKLVQHASVRSVPVIAARFAERAASFKETLAFLEDLGWLRVDADVIEPADRCVSRIALSSVHEQEQVLAECLLSGETRYAPLFARYLARFELESAQLVHRTAHDRRAEEDLARDFLMELGAVAHDIAGDYYVLRPEFAHLRVWARNAIGTRNASSFALAAQAQQALGLAAELAILEWERLRVGPEWVERVRHVANDRPGASYDIESVSVGPSSVDLRFIEVKAVSSGTYRFHWSHAEIETSQILRGRYFLYLVPVLPPSRFDLERLTIVGDPYTNVYQKPTQWQIVETDVVCESKRN